MYQPQPPQAPYPPRRQRPRGIPAWVLILACAGAGLFGMAIGAGAKGAAQSAAAPTVTVIAPALANPTGKASSAPVAPAKSPASQEITDGTWRVPEDVKPGTYRTAGAGDTGSCYWERMKDLTGGMDSTLANDLGSGPMTVTIQPGDKGFKSQGCKPWKKVG